jgi:hypothetical protein
MVLACFYCHFSRLLGFSCLWVSCPIVIWLPLVSNQSWVRRNRLALTSATVKLVWNFLCFCPLTACLIKWFVRFLLAAFGRRSAMTTCRIMGALSHRLRNIVVHMHFDIDIAPSFTAYLRSSLIIGRVNLVWAFPHMDNFRTATIRRQIHFIALNQVLRIQLLKMRLRSTIEVHAILLVMELFLRAMGFALISLCLHYQKFSGIQALLNFWAFGLFL